MEHKDERGIEECERMGDLFEEIEKEENAELVPDGMGTDANGDTVRVWKFV